MPLLGFRKFKEYVSPGAPASGVVDAPEAAIGHSVPLALAAYWRSLPREGGAPRKIDFDPLWSLPKVVPYLWLGEPLDERRSDFHVRLVGQGLIDLLNMNATGLKLGDYSGADFQLLRRWLVMALEEVRPVFLLSDYRRMARPYIEAESVACPLVDSENGREFVVVAVGCAKG